MPRLAYDDYLHHIRVESRRFRDVLTGCPPGAPVPSCPDWDAADLLWHLATVQHFWAEVVSTRAETPPAHGERRRTARPSTYAALLEGFDASHAALASALEAADPTARAWTWSSEQTIGFTFRRQAHEALIHRLDAELTAGGVTPLDPRLATDGVDEALDIMFGEAPDRFTPLPQRVRVHLTDTDATLWVQLGAVRGEETPALVVVPDPVAGVEAVLAGRAGDVDAWLWGRQEDDSLRVVGDPELCARFLACIERPIA